MERKTILEKLGLIEKVENNEDIIAADNKENVASEQNKNPEIEKTKTQFDEIVKTKVTQPQVSQSSYNAADEYDPVATVKKKRLLKIEEIYKNFDISSDGINSLSIVESFQKALPDYLPTDVKRQSILNIITSSNVQIESLIKDGSDKLICLNNFSKAFTDESNDVINNFENEINKLTEKIGNYKTAIDNMKKLQNEQNFTVKYEMDKINNILQFINPENK